MCSPPPKQFLSSVCLHFFNLLPADTAMQGKSSLNPNAALFIPSKSLPKEDNKVTKKVVSLSENSEDVGMAAGYPLLEQSLEKLNLSSVSHPHNSETDRESNGETFPAEKHSMIDDTNHMMDYLLNQFPGYSEDSLAYFLNLYDGDLDDTIDMLEQFEFDPVVPEEAPESSLNVKGYSSSCKPSSSS